MALTPTGRSTGSGGRSRAASSWRGARLLGRPAIAAVFGAAAIAGCSSSGTTSAVQAGPPPARWWSNAAVAAGSAVNPADPGAAAGRLHASTKDYCGMLAETMKAGRSVMPGAGNSASVATLRAFVAEIEKVAPHEVSGAWQVLGPALVNFAASSGKTLGSKTSAADLNRAAQQISAHATKVCHVDLTTAPSG